MRDIRGFLKKANPSKIIDMNDEGMYIPLFSPRWELPFSQPLDVRFFSEIPKRR
jgi:hypothetical protein